MDPWLRPVRSSGLIVYGICVVMLDGNGHKVRFMPTPDGLDGTVWITAACKARAVHSRHAAPLPFRGAVLAIIAYASQGYFPFVPR